MADFLVRLFLCPRRYDKLKRAVNFFEAQLTALRSRCCKERCWKDYVHSRGLGNMMEHYLEIANSQTDSTADKTVKCELQVCVP